MRKLSIGLVVLMTLTLAACQNNTDSAQVAPSDQPTANIAATSSPSATPESTATKSPTPSPMATETKPIITAGPTPDAPTWLLDDFLFYSPPPSCHLPCWQNLIAGTSTGDDVQEVFDDVFQFHGARDFTPDDSSKNSLLRFDSVYGISQQWHLNDEPKEYFHIWIWMDDGTNRLRTLLFEWVLSRENSNNPVPLSHLFQELGTPRYILVRVAGTERLAEGLLGIAMIYENGIVYTTGGHITILTENGRAVAEMCLPNLNQDDSISGASLLILEPIADLKNLNEVQSKFLQQTIEDSALLEELFSISSTEFVDKVVAGENICWHSIPLWNQ